MKPSFLFLNRRAYAGIVLGMMAVFLFVNAEKNSKDMGEARIENRKPSVATLANQKAKEEREEKGRQDIWIIKTKDAVRSHLKDPSLAQFRNVFFTRSDDVPVVCGEVNSKNGFGGYGGFQHFVGSGDSLIVLEEEMQGFAEVWNKMCTGQ